MHLHGEDVVQHKVCEVVVGERERREFALLQLGVAFDAERDTTAFTEVIAALVLSYNAGSVFGAAHYANYVVFTMRHSDCPAVEGLVPIFHARVADIGVAPREGNRPLYEFAPTSLMRRRLYWLACFASLATLVGFLVWIVVAIASKSAESYVDVLISVACLCVSVLLSFALLLHYMVHRPRAIAPVSNPDAERGINSPRRRAIPTSITVASPARMRHVVVEVDADAMHLHIAESQTSPPAFAIAVHSALDDGSSTIIGIPHAVVDA